MMDDSPSNDKREMEQTKWPKKFWDKLGLDKHTLKLMFKGACPTFAAIAIYQSTNVSHAFGDIGYLAAVVAQISMCIRPRAVFIEGAIVDAIGTCLAASMSLLASWCVVKAREHTSAPGHLAGYNSSACAVSAIWLMFNVWMASTFRAFRPQYRLNVIHYIIFIEVTVIQAAIMPTMSAVIAFEERVLKIFFIAYGLAIASNLLIFPNSCRMLVFDDVKKYIADLQSIIQAQQAYTAALSRSELFNGQLGTIDHGVAAETSPTEVNFLSDVSAEANGLQDAKRAMFQLRGKFQADLKLAKREAAWGKLGPSDLEGLYQHLRLVLLPVTGMASLPVIIEYLIKVRLDALQAEGETYHAPLIQQDVWKTIFDALQAPLADLADFTADALSHVAVVLEIDRSKHAVRSKRNTSKSAQSEDVEAGGPSICPGERKFAENLRQRGKGYTSNQNFLLEAWKKAKNFGATVDSTLELGRQESSILSQRDQQQLLIVLYFQRLLYASIDALSSTVDFAEDLVASDRLKQDRLILPGRRRLQKMFRNIFGKDLPERYDSGEEVNPPNSLEAVGDSFGKRRDPEHLPPKNTSQKIGDHIRSIGHFLGSPQSSFGARAAAAVLSVAIVGYLEPTQNFFFRQRCLWATIIIAIGMNPTSGSSIFSFIMRLIGNTVAMVVAIVNWYIVDGKTPGVLVFLFLFNFIEMYGMVKHPRYTVMFMVTIITRQLIVGYSLQVKKTGIAAAASGAAYHPIYLLGPYRLAAVAAGSFASFFWTIFPYPITARSILRKNLGHSLFLLANFYTCMHTSVELWVAGAPGDPHDKSSPGRRLEKARNRIYGKQMRMLSAIREHSSFLAWEPTIGGKFPLKYYNNIVTEMGSVLNSMVMITYAASESYTSRGSNTNSSWLEHLSRLSSPLGFTSHEITSILSLLSASVTMGQPLPPYLQAPKPYRILTWLKATDAEFLKLEHADETGYSDFAVMEISSVLVSHGLERLVQYVRELVGEVEFKFAENVMKDVGKKTEKSE